MSKVNMTDMGKYYNHFGEKGKMELKKEYTYAKSDGAEEVYHRPKGKGGYKRWGGGKDSYKQTSGLSSLTIYKRREEKAPETKSTPPPKPTVPKEQSLKIEPVKHSLEIEQAQSRAQEYQKKDYSSIFQQNDTDFTSNFNPAGKSSSTDNDPQEFADKYKLNLINSGATKQLDTTSTEPMSADDILKKDKEQYGSYM